MPGSPRKRARREAAERDAATDRPVYVGTVKAARAARAQLRAAANEADDLEQARLADARRVVVARSELAAVQLLEETVVRTGRSVVAMSTVLDDVLQAALAVDPESVHVRTVDGHTVVDVDDDRYRLAKARADAVFTAAPVPFRDAVFALDRAAATLDVLKEDAGARGTIVVRFGIPRPDFVKYDALADVVDLDPLTITAVPPAPAG